MDISDFPMECEICGEPITKEVDLEKYYQPDGPDDVETCPAHYWCVDSLKEGEHRMDIDNAEYQIGDR